MTKKHGNPAVRHVSWGTAYGITTFGCAVVYPMVATVVLNRPLTPRETYDGIADCVVPFIGGYIVDAMLPQSLDGRHAAGAGAAPQIAPSNRN